MFAEEEWLEISRRNGLSPQQAKLLRLLLTGRGDKQIATAMGISLPTVRTHMTRVFAKTGAGDRIELILKVVEQFHEGCHHRHCPRLE